MSWKDNKAICKNLRTIYTAATEPEAKRALKTFAHNWDERYPEISKKWEDNWIELSAFFDYPLEIRRMIYTTNAVESLHRLMRKTTKNKKFIGQ